MHRKLPWLGALLVVALIIAYYALTEPVTVIQRTAPDSAIQRNPYSAAQAWLAQRGQPSQRVLSAAALFPLPEEDTALIIDKQRGLLSHSQVRALLHWVEAGGELIVEARPLPKSRDEDTATERDWQDNDALLYSLGITVWKGEALADEEELDPFFQLLDALPAFAGNPLQYCLLTDNDELRETCEALACEAPPQPEPLLLHAGDDQPSRRIQLHSQHVLWHDSWNEEDTPAEFLPEWPVEVTAYADNDDGSQLVQLSLGDGQVTVLTDLGLWDNQNLLYFDHAWLLAWLLAGCWPDCCLGCWLGLHGVPAPGGKT